MCAGTMVEMPFAATPRCSRRGIASTSARTVPTGRRSSERSRRRLPVAELVPEAEELVVFSGPEAEVALRAVDGSYALEVDCSDGKLAAHIRDAVQEVLA